MNLYRDQELDLQPEFQRFFRWTALQKSKLIESLLLGIPIPSIFVAQRDDGVWDVVDGLQRLSTIFEFVGLLRDEERKLLPPIVLQATDYLPALDGKVWDDEAKDAIQDPMLVPRLEPFSQAQRLAIKRTKLSLNIIKRESAGDTKLELFHRLNSLGTRLSDQERRNCLLLLKNRELFHWANDLSKDEAFQKACNLSEALTDQRYDVELVWRFVCIRQSGDRELAKITDMSEFLDNAALKIAGDPAYPRDGEAALFRRTFAILNEALGDDVFRKFDGQRFVRSFLISAFEAIAIGAAANLAALEAMGAPQRTAFIKAQVGSLWSADDFISNMGSGKTPARRLSHLVPFGRTHFSP